MSGQRSPFDKRSFIKSMKNIGSAYRKQATELVSISRLFVTAQDQAFNPDADRSLRIALQAVDDALKSASEAKKTTSGSVDDKLERAIEALHNHESDWHPGDSSDIPNFLSVKERMVMAKATDGKTVSILDNLLDRPTPNGWSKPTTLVEFLVFKSLPDNSPTIVKQMLCEGSNLSEVLWNFSRFKDQNRIALRQNAQFYKGLDAKQIYGGDFQRDPIEKFLGTPEHKIFVLTDRQCRVHLEPEGRPRAFGNVWCPKRSLIFKDICGALVGEGIVGPIFERKPNLWYCEEHLSAPAGAGPMNWRPLTDWRQPIHGLLKSPHPDDGYIRISTEPSARPNRSRVPRHSPSASPNPPRASSGHSPPRQTQQTNATPAQQPRATPPRQTQQPNATPAQQPRATPPRQTQQPNATPEQQPRATPPRQTQRPNITPAQQPRATPPRQTQLPNVTLAQQPRATPPRQTQQPNATPAQQPRATPQQQTRHQEPVHIPVWKVWVKKVWRG